MTTYTSPPGIDAIAITVFRGQVVVAAKDGVWIKERGADEFKKLECSKPDEPPRP
jgi:hypothetical protein